jgi:hypothetical protein
MRDAVISGGVAGVVGGAIVVAALVLTGGLSVSGHQQQSDADAVYGAVRAAMSDSNPQLGNGAAALPPLQSGVCSMPVDVPSPSVGADQSSPARVGADGG